MSDNRQGRICAQLIIQKDTARVQKEKEKKLRDGERLTQVQKTSVKGSKWNARLDRNRER